MYADTCACKWCGVFQLEASGVSFLRCELAQLRCGYHTKRSTFEDLLNEMDEECT